MSFPIPKKETGATRAPAKSNTPKNRRTDTAAQLARVLAALRSGPITTVQLVREHDILDPRARIHQLRRRGYEIDTLWVMVETEPGVLHRVGQYVPRSEPKRMGDA